MTWAYPPSDGMSESLCVQRISTAEFNAGGQSLLLPTSGF
jgi:hypothetical protein